MLDKLDSFFLQTLAGVGLVGARVHGGWVTAGRPHFLAVLWGSMMQMDLFTLDTLTPELKLSELDWLLLLTEKI